MDPSLPVDAALVGLVVVIVQLVKPFIELAVASTNPEHDPLIRLLAVLLGIGGSLVLHGMPADGPATISLLGVGLGTGLASIGLYHGISGSATTVGLMQRQSAVNSALSTQPAPESPKLP